MLTLKIIGGVLFGLLLLLFFSVRLRFSMLRGELRLSVHYLFFRMTLIPRRPKREKAKKGKTPAKKKKPEKEEPPKPPEEKKKQPIRELYAQYLPLLRTAKNSLQKLLKHIIIYKVEAGINVARKDAHQTAIAYAKTASLVLALTDLLGFIFTFRKKYIRVSPAFPQDKTTVNFSLRVRVRPIFILASGVEILIAFLRATPKKTHKNKSNRKGGQHHEPAASNR